MIGARNAAFTLVMLAGCPAAPPPDSPPPPAPPSAAAVVGSAPADTPPPDPVPLVSPAISIFAEGWDITVGRTRGPALIHDRGLEAAVLVERDQVRRADEIWRGLPRGPWRWGSLTGGLPEGAILTMGESAAEKPHWGYRRTQAGWVRQRGVSFEHDIVAGPGRASLALDTWSQQDGKTLVLSVGGGDGEVRRIGTSSTMGMDQIVASHPSGEVAVLGRLASGAPVIERFHAGTVIPDRVELPAKLVPKLDAAGLCLSGDGAAYVVARDGLRASVITVRGSSVAVTAIPGELARFWPTTCAVSGGGSVWLLPDGQHVYLLGAGDSLSRVALPALPALARTPEVRADPADGMRLVLVPEGSTAAQQDAFSPSGLWASEDGSVWIEGVRTREGRVLTVRDQATHHLARRVILRVGPPLAGTPIDWDTITPNLLRDRVDAWNVHGWAAGRADLRAMDDRCRDTFVEIAPMDRVRAPDVQRARALAAEVPGTRLFEARLRSPDPMSGGDDGGPTVLGAAVTTPAAGRKLLALVRDRMGARGGRLHCGTAEVVRALGGASR